MAPSNDAIPGWSGRYSDGRSARSHPVVAQPTAAGLHFTGTASETIGGVWPFAEIRLLDDGAGRNGGAIRLARFDSGERLTLDDPAVLARLEPLCPQLRQAAEADLPWRMIALWSGAALAAILLLVFAVIPYLANHASAWVSPRLEAALGDRVADAIIAITVPPAQAQHRECDAPAGRAALDQLVAPLAAQAQLRHAPRLRIVNGPMINAFALPGGQILVYRGLLDFAEDPNELAGIVAHELGHLALDHPTALVIRQSATAFLIGLLFGDVFGGSAVAIASTAVIDSRFGREAESAADRDAIAFMRGAGLDLAPFGAFFARFEQRQPSAGAIAFLESHPANDERAKLVNEAGAGGKAALDRPHWAALKAICQEPRPATEPAQKKAAP